MLILFFVARFSFYRFVMMIKKPSDMIWYRGHSAFFFLIGWKNIIILCVFLFFR